MQSNPLISIYIPTHNRVEKLERALNSVFCQTYKNYEVLICDDGSTDETQVRMRKLVESNNQVRYFRNPLPLGACSARNLGIFAARGQFITGLDDDDEFTKDRIEKFIFAWEDNYAFICSNFENKYKNGKKLINYKNNKLNFTIKDLLVKNEASNQIFTRTERLRDINGFRVDVKRFQDWDTWIKICNKYGDFIRLPTALYLMHHDHADNEHRVSKNMPTHIAIDELCNRNSEIYDKKSEFIIRSYSRFLQHKFTIHDMIKNIIYKKSIKPIFYFLFQNLK